MAEPTEGRADGNAARPDGDAAPKDGDVTDGFELAGTPDAFGRLWTPHRMAYVTGGQGRVRDESGCPFCAAPERTDEDGLIVYRGRTSYAVLNLFPYNPGHLLVCPYRHVADYTDITAEETAEMAEITQTAMRVIRKVANPHGFNLGINQGDAGGAGIAAHLHQHVVPRWGGDANFLPIIAQTKQITQTLDETRTLLAEAWPEGGKDAGAQ
ncbi:HIT domain-containing protein [Sinomonas halotolerans]|uniref:HIT domain-containing protein n=1 Tax=Sinomonas halotolerans TaxID=1644133 RepID=A0ABU9WZL5_9MICC